MSTTHESVKKTQKFAQNSKLCLKGVLEVQTNGICFHTKTKSINMTWWQHYKVFGGCSILLIQVVTVICGCNKTLDKLFLAGLESVLFVLINSMHYIAKQNGASAFTCT